MPETRDALHTGGCQCGAVRYALYAEPEGVHICHCRMCQKAFGSFFAPLAPVRGKDFAWTKGEPSLFKSSAVVERGFCPACGTPLSFRYTDRDRTAISIGSLDDPATVRPTEQFGTESRMPWFHELHALPGKSTEEDFSPERLAQLESFQHPDRED